MASGEVRSRVGLVVSATVEKTIFCTIKITNKQSLK